MNQEHRVDYDVVKRACDDIAFEMNLPMDRFAVRTRDNYIKAIYNSCYQCVTPYNEMAYKWVNSTINGNLASWYANEYSVYKNAPMEWQKDAKETIVGMFKEAYPEREDLKEDYEEYGLPTSFSVLLSDAEKEEMADSEDEEEFVSDYITNKYGFCHNGFNYEIVGDELIVNNVQWDIDEEDEFDFDDDELDENLTQDSISGDTLMQEVYDFIISESNEDRLVPFDAVRNMMNERGLRLEDYFNDLLIRDGQEGLLLKTIDGDQYIGPVSLLDKRSDEVAIVKKEEQKLEKSVNRLQDKIDGEIAAERKWLEDATYGDIDELVDNVKYIYVEAPRARKYQPLIRKLFGQDADKVHITKSDNPNAKWSISADIYVKDVDKLPAALKAKVNSNGTISSIGLAVELYRAGAKLSGSKEVKESFGAHLLKEDKDIKDKMYVGIWDDAKDDFVEYEEFDDFQDALEFASKYDYSKIKSGTVKFDTNSLFTKGFASEFDIVDGKTDLKAMQELMPKKEVNESLQLTEGHVEQKYKRFELDVIVKDSINHLVNDLGKDPDAEDFADDVVADIENNYDISVPDDFNKYQDWVSQIMQEVSRQLKKNLDESTSTESKNLTEDIEPFSYGDKKTAKSVFSRIEDDLAYSTSLPFRLYEVESDWKYPKQNFNLVGSSYYNYYPKELKTDIEHLKQHIKSIGGKYISSSYGRIHFYLDKTPYIKSMEEEQKQFDDDYERRKNEYEDYLKTIDVSKYKPSQAVIDKLMNYRSSGSKVNVKAIRSIDKLLTYLYAACLMGWSDLLGQCFDAVPNDYQEVAEAIDLQCDTDNKLVDDRDKDTKSISNKFSKVTSFLHSNKIKYKYSYRDPGSSELSIDRRNGLCYTIGYLLTLEDMGKEVKFADHTHEGGGTSFGYTVSGIFVKGKREAEDKIIEIIQRYLSQNDSDKPLKEYDDDSDLEEGYHKDSFGQSNWYENVNDVMHDYENGWLTKSRAMEICEEEGWDVTEDDFATYFEGFDDIKVEQYEDEYDDFEQSGIYGGDLTYCPICDTRLKYDEYGDHYCPKCKEDAHSLSMKRKTLMKESKVSPLDRAVEIYTTMLNPYGNLNSPFDDEEDYIEDLKDTFKNKQYAEYFISEYEDDDDAKAQEFVSLLKNIHSIKEAVDPTKAKEVKKNSDAWAVLYGYKFRNEPEVELEPEEHDEKSLRARINEIVSSYNGKGNRPSKNAKETDFIFYVLYR